MEHYITFSEKELNSTITTLGCNLHKIAERLIYFQQYAKILGVQHDYVVDSAIMKINKAIITLNQEFNLPQEPNACLDIFSEKHIEDVIERANKDHGNTYAATIPKMRELIRSFNSIAEREGKDTNWEAVKLQCIKML